MARTAFNRALETNELGSVLLKLHGPIQYHFDGSSIRGILDGVHKETLAVRRDIKRFDGAAQRNLEQTFRWSRNEPRAFELCFDFNNKLLSISVIQLCPIGRPDRFVSSCGRNPDWPPLIRKRDGKNFAIPQFVRRISDPLAVRRKSPQFLRTIRSKQWNTSKVVRRVHSPCQTLASRS